MVIYLKDRFLKNPKPTKNKNKTKNTKKNRLNWKLKVPCLCYYVSIQSNICLLYVRKCIVRHLSQFIIFFSTFVDQIFLIIFKLIVHTYANGSQSYIFVDSFKSQYHLSFLVFEANNVEWIWYYFYLYSNTCPGIMGHWDIIEAPSIHGVPLCNRPCQWMVTPSIFNRL